MGFISDVLLGQKAKPGTQQSGLRELIDIFPELQGVGEDIIGRGVGIAGQQAPFTPAQIAGLSGLEQQGLAGLAGLSAAPGATFRPNLRLGQRAGERFEQAGGLLQQGAAPITGGEIQTGISQFLNPFEQQVISNVEREAQEAGSLALSNLAARATATGGFGGTRQALQEGVVPERIAQRVGDISASLRQRGFESAAGRALQNLQFGRTAQLQAGGQLGALGGQLFGAREGVERIRGAQQAVSSQQLQDQIRLAQAQGRAGQLPRGIEQAGLLREQQIGQIPLQQLGLLQGLLGGFPAGATQRGGRAATSGLLASGGNIGQGIGNILSLGFGGFGGFGGGGLGAGGGSIVPSGLGVNLPTFGGGF